MLRRLYIENYALIERLSLDFDKGLTVITGETGTGKSILLGALSLILGQRAETRIIKEGETRCLVEADFDLSAYNMKDFFQRNDLEYGPTGCLLRRELYNNGKSRAFVNDSPVSQTILKELTMQLTDIHSQHQNLLIGKDRFQLDILDAVAGNQLLRTEYQSSYQHFRTIQTELRQLTDSMKNAREEEDFLRFQYDQLKAANLIEGEQEALEAEWQVLTHAEEIKTGLGKLFSWLDDEENGIITNLHQALIQAEGLKKHFSKIEEHETRLRSNYIDLKDLSSEIGILLNDVEINPARMEQVNDRINLLYSLQQKHRVSSLSELISLRDELSERLSGIALSDETLNDLQKEVKEAEQITLEKATRLSRSRQDFQAVLGERLTNLLKQLGIPKAQLDITISGKTMDSDGIDTVRFLFSANKNARLQPIDEIASGGEISRIMLCIKSVIADSMKLSTLIFDEIDTGISGEIAHRMGEIMQDIAANRQVICITHLPQIAAKGRQHLKVSKTENKEYSQTVVTLLNYEERLTEIARMLSGANVTEAAILNARNLLTESIKK